MENSTNKNFKGNTKEAKQVRDYGNDPYFVKKGNKSKVFLEKHGFPKDLLDKRGVRV